MRLNRAERVVRAVCSDKFDPATRKVAKSLFKGAEISLSRLDVVPIGRQWRLLASTVQKLPGRRLERLGEIGVDRIEDVGAAYRRDEKGEPVPLTVVEDRLPHNEAHAIIVEDIKSDALAKALVSELRLHDPPEGFVAENIARVL
jgi:hypothetical protein